MTDLITKAEYKAYRGINSAQDDGRLDAIIPAVSNLVKAYCGKTFIDYFGADKTEKFSLKWYQKSVFLSEIPIASIVSVKEIQVGSNTAYDTLTTDQYLVDGYLDAIYRVEEGAPIYFPTGINAVEVVYRGGYSTTPADLKLAVYDLVTYYLKDQYLPEKNHASFTIRYNAEAPDFPDHIKRVLDMYKNV